MDTVRARLYAIGGALVGTVDLPPWEEPPGGILLEGRLFVRSAGDAYAYLEGIVWYASTQARLELKARPHNGRCLGDATPRPDPSRGPLST